MRLNAVAARCSSLAAASSPRRENLSMIFLRLPIPGSTVAPRRLYKATPSTVRRRCSMACLGVAPARGGPVSGSSRAVLSWSRFLLIAISRSGRRQIRVAAVAGIGEHNADRMVGSTGYLVQVLCGGLGGAHHGRERGHVVRGLTDLNRGDDLVTGHGHLGVVAL